MSVLLRAAAAAPSTSHTLHHWQQLLLAALCQQPLPSAAHTCTQIGPLAGPPPPPQPGSRRASSTSSSTAQEQQHLHHHQHQHQQQQPSSSSSLLYVLPMPSLSHAMTSGRVTKWLKAPGDTISIYDLVAEVTTDSLVDEAYKVDDFAGSVTLLLESQEEAHLAAVLVPEGQEVAIGTPIAVLSEDATGAAAAADAAQQLAGVNVYDEGQTKQQQELLLQGRRFNWQLLEWQSYLKEGSSKDSSSGSGCGCM